jgi:hypothetical protein
MMYAHGTQGLRISRTKTGKQARSLRPLSAATPDLSIIEGLSTAKSTLIIILQAV